MRSGVVPAEMLSATNTLAKGPCVAGKPCVLQSRHSRLPATQGWLEGDNLESNPFRIGKAELGFAVVVKTVAFIRHVVQAPGTEPVSFDGADFWSRAAFRCRFDDWKNRLARCFY